MLVGVVVGGIDRLWTATLGGFAIGVASGLINGLLPTDKTVYLPSAVFALVILVLLLRPSGPVRLGQPRRRPNAYERAGSTRSCSSLGPALLVRRGRPGLDDRLALERGLLPERARRRRDRRLDLRLRRQLGRALLRPDQLRRRRRVRCGRDDGAARVEAGRAARRSSRSCATTRSATCRRCCSLRRSAALFAFLVGLPLMRLSGLAAGIATFAVLEITHNVLQLVDEDRPAARRRSRSSPRRPGSLQATLGALVAIVGRVRSTSAAASAGCCGPRARTPAVAPASA